MKTIRVSFFLALCFAIGLTGIVSIASAQTYFTDNFDDPNESQKKWVPLYGQWEFRDKEYHQLMNAVNCMSVVSDDYWKDEWNDYTFEVKGIKTGGAEGFLIMFRCMGKMQDRGVALKAHPPRMEKQSSLQYWWNIGGWGNTTSYLNGREVGMVEDDTQDGKGRIGLGTWSTLARFDDVIVYGPKGPSQTTAVNHKEKATATWAYIKSGLK